MGRREVAWLALTAYGFAAVALLGCGDDPGSPSAAGAGASGDPQVAEGADGASANPGVASPRFTVEGRGESGKTSTVLEVVEGDEQVTLSITGADASDNLLVINASLAGVAAVVGEHHLPIGPVNDAGVFAIGSVDGGVYHSLSGQLDLSLSAEGRIEGRFDMALALEEFVVVLPGEGPPEAAVDLTLTGSFESEWTVTCYSYIRGFTGGHFVTNSPYCNSLAF